MMKNWKGFGRKLSWLNLRYHPGIRLEGLRKIARNLNQDSRLLGPRMESRTSRIQSRSINHKTTTFGGRVVVNVVTNLWVLEPQSYLVI
jgi:hypothetical protein